MVVATGCALTWYSKARQSTSYKPVEIVYVPVLNSKIVNDETEGNLRRDMTKERGGGCLVVRSTRVGRDGTRLHYDYRYIHA